MRLKALLLAGLLLVTGAAYADVYKTYSLAWSGASFGNNATATGLMTLDLTTLPNPSGFETNIYNDITSLTVTVSGASSGNGTFTKADLPTLVHWWTAGVKLNLLKELVGQPTTGNPWGTPDSISGDFNFFFSPPGPVGTNFFTMTTNFEAGDQILLTSFSPVEPGSVLLFGTGIAGLAGVLRRRLRG